MVGTVFLVCSLLGPLDLRKGKGVLVETAFTNFKKMYEVCDLHAAREYHKDAIAVCDAFGVNLTERRSKGNYPEQQKEALLYYGDHFLCGRQNIALHGHHDSGTDMEGVQTASTNHTTFVLCSTFISRLETLGPPSE